MGRKGRGGLAGLGGRVRIAGRASLVAVAGLAWLSGAAGVAARQAGQPPPKVDIVSTAGCLKESAPDSWTLTNATDPAPSSANAPQQKDLPLMPVFGKNSFQLIGVSIFNLPAHRDHTVVVKGLLVKASPVSRLNITSVTMVAATCAPGPAK